MTEWKTKRVIGGYAIFTDKDVVVDLSEAEAKLAAAGKMVSEMYEELRQAKDERIAELEAELKAANDALEGYK